MISLQHNNQHNSKAPCAPISYLPFGTSKPIEAGAFSDTEDHRIAQRILRRLANDIKTSHPSVKIPPTWMQRQLIRSHICGKVQTDWRQAMLWTLKFIQQSATLEKAHTYFMDFDAHRSLFPNAEGYQLSELRTFVNACLESHHLHVY